MRFEKLKKRSLAALITTSVVAGVLLINILVSYIASANILYLDLTKTNYTEITEKSDEYLSKGKTHDLQGSPAPAPRWWKHR